MGIISQKHQLLMGSVAVSHLHIGFLGEVKQSHLKRAQHEHLAASSCVGHWAEFQELAM